MIKQDRTARLLHAQKSRDACTGTEKGKRINSVPPFARKISFLTPSSPTGSTVGRQKQSKATPVEVEVEKEQCECDHKTI
jgi:hypothetical protein